MTAVASDTADIDRWVAHFATQFDRLTSALDSVIVGKPGPNRLAMVAMLSGGHLLIEDVPGTGKTSMAKAMAAISQGSWSRIQFTPDLLPTDVTGVTVWNQRSTEFEFRPGPIFANVVIADEINRSSPKTQSALLEVMEERQVTVDGRTHPLPSPFVVVATQNPTELHGTYPLPESQLDRFAMRIRIGYPGPEAERHIVLGRRSRTVLPPAVVDQSGFEELISIADAVHISDAVADYVVALIGATRERPELRLGVSSRGSLALIRGAQVLAGSQGRPFVEPEDVKFLAPSVLAHRLFLTTEAQVTGITAESVLSEVLDGIPVPRARS